MSSQTLARLRSAQTLLERSLTGPTTTCTPQSSLEGTRRKETHTSTHKKDMIKVHQSSPRACASHGCASVRQNLSPTPNNLIHHQSHSQPHRVKRTHISSFQSNNQSLKHSTHSLRQATSARTACRITRHNSLLRHTHTHTNTCHSPVTNTTVTKVKETIEYNNTLVQEGLVSSLSTSVMMETPHTKPRPLNHTPQAAHGLLRCDSFSLSLVFLWFWTGRLSW